MFITQNSVLICVNKSIPSWLNFLVSSTRKRVSDILSSIHRFAGKEQEDCGRTMHMEHRVGWKSMAINLRYQLCQKAGRLEPSRQRNIYDRIQHDLSNESIVSNQVTAIESLICISHQRHGGSTFWKIPAGAIDCLRFNIIILCSLVRSFCFDTVPSGTHRLHSFCFACIYYCILGRTVLLPQIAGSYKISSSSLHFVEVFRSQLFAASVTTSISTRIWPKLMKQYILQMVVQQATEESRSFNDDCTMKIQL
uniref:AlNc14C39G3388 protein n=1 Tax=Albugo laibachii Nc14 TaxID=890382 RepID=F0W9C1_9STRA|nr:AlNc14C39G3388 [Albugo laibachii Nc14]CCA18380.1 AlNc14C49G3913 [Albugo laibachii Nc14]|eukprot:CCA18380.1 AlNc14C49G3913 [Albugo laibachii Nc14]